MARAERTAISFSETRVLRLRQFSRNLVMAYPFTNLLRRVRRPFGFRDRVTWLITRCLQTSRRDFVCGVPRGEQFLIYAPHTKGGPRSQSQNDLSRWLRTFRDESRRQLDRGDGN